MAWITPVTDRVLADVTNKTAKGVANAVDFNRVESNTEVLSGLFGLTLTVKTDWERDDIPTSAVQTRIVENAQECIDAYYVPPTTPSVPTVPINTYTKWNDLEKVLLDLYNLYYDNRPNLFTGEFYTGELVGDM